MRKFILGFLALFSLTGSVAFAQSGSAGFDIEGFLDDLIASVPTSSPAQRTTTPPPTVTPNTSPLDGIDISSLIQQTTPQGVNSGMDIQLNPPYPQPGETFTASLNDYATRVYGAGITWRNNGTVLEGAKDRRSITLTAPAAGERQTITASLLTSSGEILTFEKLIEPLYLDIIVEPQTHVPDFYSGRALPSYASHVLVTALISDPALRARDLIYTWRINRDVIEGGPIRGRSSTVFNMPRGSAATLSVEVGTADGTVIALRSVALPSVRPELSFYETNPLFGLYETAVSDRFPLVGKNLSLQAEPYYLDSAVFNDPDIIEWQIDNQAVTNNSFNPYTISLQRSSNFGTSNISFHVRSRDQLLQGAESSVRISF